MTEPGMLDARVDYLTLRIEELHDRLILRADELDRLKHELPVGSAQRLFAVGIAAEFRQLADVLE
jgi:hypothetical protein